MVTRRPQPFLPLSSNLGGMVTKVISIVRFNGQRQKNRALQYEVQQKLSVRLPLKRLNAQELTKEVTARLKNDGIAGPIILLDASANPLSRMILVDDLRAPGKKVLAATVAHYEKFVGPGSASKTLKEKLADSPMKKHTATSVKPKPVRTLQISDSDHGFEEQCGVSTISNAQLLNAIEQLDGKLTAMTRTLKAVLAKVAPRGQSADGGDLYIIYLFIIYPRWQKPIRIIQFEIYKGPGSTGGC